jgi:hypothetical protein
MAASPSPPRLPRWLTVPGDALRSEPAIWHVLGMTLWSTGLLPRPIRQWWSRRFVQAVVRAANERREAENPEGV